MKEINDSNSVNKIGEIKDKEKNRCVEIILIARIEAYSAIKIKANGPALYSVLNPDTSSDSPSAKSKGVRLVSAWIVISQKRAINGRRAIEGVKIKFFLKEKDWNSIIKEIKINAMDTSYEIVWAMARNAPRREYFELESHPAPRVG